MEMDTVFCGVIGGSLKINKISDIKTDIDQNYDRGAYYELVHGLNLTVTGI